MNNKWLICSCIATGVGILAGAGYLMFSEYSVLSGYQDWVLSSFWSNLLLWTFVVMFLMALVFNVLAFLELERQEDLLNPMAWLNEGKGARSQQQYKYSTDLLLEHLQRDMDSLERHDSHYLVRNRHQALLVYIQQDAEEPLTVSLVRSVFQQMLMQNCQRGLIVSCQRINSQVRLFANEAGIELFDHQKLKRYLSTEQSGQLALI
ncbi:MULTISPECIES: restriction endonuclease [Rheinheimera]|uniref:Restriction endonuclease n=1 Tax=Rheinheimera marina TaxID=1774958 RepID=A0ABV9JMS5_9GAMM